MSLSDKQREVLDVLTAAQGQPLSLDEIKRRVGDDGHGVTQALVALVRKRMIQATDDGYRRP